MHQTAQPGFDSGQAFRPTINSYMYAMAVACQHCRHEGRTATTTLYRQRAADLRERVMRNFVERKLQPFTDSFEQTINMYITGI